MIYCQRRLSCLNDGPQVVRFKHLNDLNSIECSVLEYLSCSSRVRRYLWMHEIAFDWYDAEGVKIPADHRASHYLIKPEANSNKSIIVYMARLLNYRPQKFPTLTCMARLEINDQEDKLFPFNLTEQLSNVNYVRVKVENVSQPEMSVTCPIRVVKVESLLGHLPSWEILTYLALLLLFMVYIAFKLKPVIAACLRRPKNLPELSVPDDMDDNVKVVINSQSNVCEDELVKNASDYSLNRLNSLSFSSSLNV